MAEDITIKVTMRQRIHIINGQLVDVVMPADPPRLELEEQKPEPKEAETNGGER